MIIDCHTHLLPGIDDGAKDLSTSLEMLKEEKKQGVDYVIATPHFYANRDKLEKFIDRREWAYSEVLTSLSLDDAERLNEEIPGIKLGAEVAYFNEISKAEDIERLCVEGTKTLLVEMPFSSWDDKVIEEISDLSHERNLDIVIVHIERFLGFPGNEDKVGKLLDIPVVLQMNAECLIEKGLFKGKKAKKLIEYIESGKVLLLGSDCHSMGTRKPNLLLGREMLSKEALDRIDEVSKEIFGL